MGRVAGRVSRVTDFPAGRQENALVGTFMAGIEDATTTTHEIAAPADQVWTAAQAVTREFAKVGGRAISGIDHQSMRVKNGAITTGAAVGGSVGSWLDEFVTEVTTVSESRSRISITRKLVTMTQPRGRVVGVAVAGDKTWKTARSNGDIERWIITRIEDTVAGTTSADNSR